MSVGDERAQPWFWLTPAATAAIRKQYRTEVSEKGAISTAPIAADDPAQGLVLATYTSLCELANEARARPSTHGDSTGFEADRKKIRYLIGASLNTVDRCSAVLERTGLLRIERRKADDKLNLPNRFWLKDTEASKEGGPSQGLGVAPQGREGGPSQGRNSLKKELKKNNSLLVGEVVAHHRRVFAGTLRRTEAHADEERIVGKTLEVASVDEANSCIDACFASDFHQKRGEHAGRTGGKHYSIGAIFKPKREKGETVRSRVDMWLDRKDGSAGGNGHVDLNAESDRILREQGVMA